MIGSTSTETERSVLADVDRRFARFVRECVNPESAERDVRGEPCPPALVREAGRIGLVGYGIPRDAGGGGADRLAFGIALERLGYLCSDTAFPILVAVWASIATTIHESGRPDLIERYVVPVARGERLPAFSYTENADPFSFRSSAVRRPEGGWLVNGVKRPVLGGALADVVLTYVRGADNDLVALLVERGDPGVELEPITVNALRSGGTCALRMTDVVVPDHRVLAPADGLAHAQHALNARRLTVMCPPLGRLRALHERCVRIARETVRDGRPIAEMQNVQAILGRMYVSIEACRALTYRALDPGRRDASPIWDPLLSAAKHFVADQATRLMVEALRPLATHGFLDAELGRLLRDFTTLIAVSGTQDSIEVNLGLHAVHEVMAADQRARRDAG